MTVKMTFLQQVHDCGTYGNSTLIHDIEWIQAKCSIVRKYVPALCSFDCSTENGIPQSQESGIGNHVHECATPVMGKFPMQSPSLSDQNKLPLNKNVCILPTKLVEEMSSSMQAKSQDMIEVEEEISDKPKDHSITEESGANETLSRMI